MGKLADIIEHEYGFHIRAERPPFSEQLSTTAVQIFKANPDRISWTIINLGSVAVYLAHEEAVSTTNGIYVAANGGSIMMVWHEDGELVAYSVWAVATSGTPTIYVSSVVGG